MLLKFKRFDVIFIGIALSAAILWNLWLGPISISDFFDASYRSIIWEVRLPRLMTAAFCGGAMATAGTLSQSLFNNGLASPSILGTEAGAGLGLALCHWFLGPMADSFLVMVSSSVGAAMATLSTLLLAKGSQVLTRLLLAGFALNAFLAAATALIVSLAMEQGAGTSLYHSLLGSFSARTWAHFAVIAITCMIGGIFALRNGAQLDVLSLGDETAKTTGISIDRLRTSTLLTIAILVGGSMSVGGALPFVGLIVPHLVRLASGPYVRGLLARTSMAGAAITLVADGLARTMRAPIEMDVGLLTTIIGAPYFLWLLRREQRP